MAEHVLASTMIAPKTFKIREYPMPDIPPDAGLLQVEATGVCGSQAALHHRAGRGRPGGEINVGSLGRAKIVLKRANGHSYFAVEQAIRLIASGKYPLSELCTHSYGLADVGLAIRTVAGDGVPGGIHVSVLPWHEA